MRFVSLDGRGTTATARSLAFPRIGRLAAAAAALALAACGGERTAPTEAVTPTTPSLAQLSCVASASRGTISCSAPSATSPSGVSADIIYGGQNVNVRLAQTAFSFDGGTRTLSSTVQLTNLKSEAIGTSDGTTASANGVRVFFAVQPTNGVSIVNADGTGTFTASNQPYFQYAAPLAPQASASKSWSLRFPAGVDTTTFQVLVSAAVPSETATAPTPRLVINEFMADPSKVADNLGEWFELYNPTTADIDIKGYRIVSLNDPTVHTIATSVIVPAKGYAVLGRNPDQTTNGGVKLDYNYGTCGTGPTSGCVINLANNATDWLVIRDASAGNGVTMDSVVFGVTPTGGTAKGVIDPEQDNTNAGGPNWANQTTTYGLGDKGTPGAANSGSAITQPAGPVASVTVSPATKTLAPGGTFFYTASAKDANGVAATTTYTWATSDSSLATVASNGSVTAQDVGTVTIYATSANGVTGSAVLTVSAGTSTGGAVTYRDALQFGVPTGTPTGFDASEDFRLVRPQYTLEYNDKRHLPQWVAWDLNPSVFGPAQRCDCFSPDPLLPSGMYRVVTTDYTGSGYDRGHMVTSAQRTATDAENLTTFYLTNIIPQAPENNQGPWASEEIYLSNLAEGGKQVYIFSGGVFPDSPQYISNSTGTKIPIATSTWKIAIVFQNGGTTLADIHSAADIQVIAIEIPNTIATATGIRNVPWQNYKTTVDHIEQVTGYDFLSALPDDIEAAVEAAVAP